MSTHLGLWKNGLEAMKELFKFLTIGVPHLVRKVHNVKKITVLFKRFENLYERIR
jgi:hypothetical protein